MFSLVDQHGCCMLAHPEVKEISSPWRLRAAMYGSALQTQLHFFLRLIPEIDASTVEGNDHCCQIADKIQCGTELHLGAGDCRQPKNCLYATPAATQNLGAQFTLNGDGEAGYIEIGIT